MNKADANLLSQLFKENNDLRAQINILNRDVNIIYIKKKQKIKTNK